MALREELIRIQDMNEEAPNEEATKQALVLPVLVGLGWDSKNLGQVVPESPIGMDKKQRVDYALNHPNSEMPVYIEVKSQGTSLDTQHVRQILQYAFEDNTRICTLTNGIDWWFYLPFEKGSPKERRFAELNIKKDSIEQLIVEFETYLSFESLADSDKVVEHATQVLEARRNSDSLRNEFPKIWRELLDHPPSDLIELIENRVYKSTGLRPSSEEVLSLLSEQMSIPTKLRENSIKTDTVSRKKEKKSFAKVSKASFIIEILGKQIPVNSNREIWKSVVEELYSRQPQNFSSIVGKPQGKRSYIEVGNSGLSTPYQIKTTKYWIELAGSADHLKQRSKNLLRLLGFQENDLVILDSSEFQKNQKILKSTKKVKSSNQPDAFTLFGATHSVKTWRDVWEGVASELYKRHTDNFIQVVGKPNGKRRTYVELSGKTMIKPRQVEKSEYWIEVNASSKYILSRCYYLLKLFGYSENDLKIHF